MNERPYKGRTAETYMQMSSALYIYDIKCIMYIIYKDNQYIENRFIVEQHWCSGDNYNERKNNDGNTILIVDIVDVCTYSYLIPIYTINI